MIFTIFIYLQLYVIRLVRARAKFLPLPHFVLFVSIFYRESDRCSHYQCNSIPFFLKRIKLHLSEACTKLNHSILHFKHFKFYFCNPILKDSFFLEKDFYFPLKFSIQATSWTCSAVRGWTLLRTQAGMFPGEDQAVALKQTSHFLLLLLLSLTDPVVFCMIT